MDDLTSTAGIAALGACVVALVALVLAATATWRLHGVARRQRVLLGDGGARDLVHHAAELDLAVRALREHVDALAAALDGRLDGAEQRLDTAFSNLGVVRYDAYDDLAGRQSTTIALLDHSRSGVVLSSLHHRDQARLYAKRVRDGRGELELSPEEQDAVRMASPSG